MPPPQRTELRDFIIQRFNRGELGQLCADYFPDFYRDYDGTDTPLTLLANKLVEHCERRDLLDNLRAAVHKLRSEPYEKLFGRPRVTEVKTRPRDPNQVFLSYAYEDAELARRLADDLRAAGLSVWIAPDSIQPGELWAKAIDRGLRESGIFVVALTPNVERSSWVEQEILVAVQFERGWCPGRGLSDSVPDEYQTVPPPGRKPRGGTLTKCQRAAADLSDAARTL